MKNIPKLKAAGWLAIAAFALAACEARETTVVNPPQGETKTENKTETTITVPSPAPNTDQNKTGTANP